MPSLVEFSQGSGLGDVGMLANPLGVPAQQEQQPAGLRAFGEPLSTRKLIFDNVLGAAGQLTPMENRRHTLTLEKPHYHGRDKYSVSDRKKAILEGRTLSRKLKGTWVLRDKTTGDVVDQRTMTVANVPYLTDGGTFVHNGNEYTLSNQLRLRAGNFSRIKDNGEIETHANIMPGKGRSHRYFLDPEKGVFYARVEQAKIPLINLLRVLGASDKTLRDAWGEQLFQSNARLYSDANALKMYDRFVRRKEPDATTSAKMEALKAAVEEMEIDPEVSQRTLGAPYKNLNLDALMATTKKLAAISRGEADVDDRDHLAYQTIHGPEDLFAERLTKDYGGSRRTMFNRASWTGSLSKFQPGALTKQLESALLNSGLGQALEEINPADVLDKQFRISRLGEGGIPSIDAVPKEARAVQPSHFGFLDPIRTPESFKVGVDVYISSASRKGADGRLYSPFQDPKSGKTVWRSPQDVADLAVTFPGELSRPTKRVFAMQGGRLRAVKKKDVSLVLPHFENAFSPLANMVPLKSTVKGQRLAMASRMLTQALPLVDAEAPLVQTAVPEGGESYERRFGTSMGAQRADCAGRVRSVRSDGITMQCEDGSLKKVELYNNFPYNRKTYIHQTPTVRAGDQIQRGDLLARSNYTNEKGVTALGKNARVAYIPFRGKNFEDAIVISQGFANRLSSEHMYQHKADFDEEYRHSKREFLGMFPSKFNRGQLDTIDADGAVEQGTTVEFGDPLVLSAAPSVVGRHKVHRRKAKSFDDHTIVWNHHSPGVVTDVVKTKKGTTVLVKSVMPMQVGDKLSGRYGDKGIISEIVPDNEMPADREGTPYEVLLNPLGVITRTNPAQLIEAALGKIAAARGEPYSVPDFGEIEDMAEWALQEMRRSGTNELEDLYDPETDRKIGGIFTGNRFFMKLHHTAEGKGQGRGTGGYTMEEAPAKGGETGAKRISLMDTNALLSHGATQVLRDASTVRGQRNEDFWLAYMQGNTPAAPKVPLVFRKFVNELKAAGINVVPDGGNLNIMALTDKDVDELAGRREITNGETVDFARGLEPIKGGLFDSKLTGGHQGNRWGFVKLTEPMPNPVMEEPIRRVLGLTQKKFEDVVACRAELEGNCGPEAISNALGKINVSRELARARIDMKQGRKTLRDSAVRKLGYLKAAERLGIHPREWMLSKVPVLPPAFRPLSVMEGNDIPIVADANFLYKELIDANSLLKDMKKNIDDVGDERLALYKAFKAVTGLGDPVHPKLREKRVGGILKHIFGSSPKLGTVQRRLLSSPVDLVGRAVISPDPDLDMDHVGLPETRAWDVYRNFVVRRLKRKGMPVTQALRAVEDRTPQAKQSLLDEMEHRPVFINRAPVLHRFGIMAFWPKLTKGDTLRVSPLVVGGFGADFDGDAMQYHVPVTEGAREEAINLMTPSRNLLSPADFKTPVHAPSQEYISGLYAATRQRKYAPGDVRTYASKADAIRAYKQGKINIGTAVRILTDGDKSITDFLRK